VPAVDHHFARFSTPLQAFREEGGVCAADATATVLDWLRKNV
jgi:hypothetical protein